MTHLSDPELVRRTLQGDTAAFGTLVERYKQVVYGVCVSLLGDFALAQDLAQEAFLKAFQHVHRLTMPERFGHWLCIIARNECRMRYQVTTTLTPRQALAQARADFGPGGIGLQITSQTNLGLVFQGGGGPSAVTAQPGAETTLALETREWDNAVETCMARVHRRRPW